MKKLRLSIDQLTVEVFSMGQIPPIFGTVQANATGGPTHDSCCGTDYCRGPSENATCRSRGCR